MNPRYFYDAGLIFLCLCMALISYLLLGHGGKDQSDMVVIEEAGVTIATFPLSEDMTYEYADGDNWNQIQILQGEVFVSDANCRNHQCIQQGKISHRGEVIACLPHKLIISISGSQREQLDGMVK